MFKKLVVSMLSTAVLLAGCLGGGGGADTTGANATPPSDTTPPAITLVGANPQTVEAGSVYADPGATALDNVDGNIAAANIVVNCNVNTTVVGVYSCTYNVSDSSGNPATQVTRTVNVVDTTGPVITVQGANPDSVLVGSGPYSDPGATAVDHVDGARPFVANCNVNTAVVGTYSCTYTATDLSTHTSTATRTVNVIPAPDTTPPVITLNGANPQTIYVGDPYVELSATATDDVDGNITANIAITGTVDTTTAGTYIKYYNVSDSSGNPATQVTRTVNVVAVPMLTTGKIFYPGFDEAEKAARGGDGAIYTEDLSVSSMTRLWGGYQCLPNGCAVMYPTVIVPNRNGGKVVSQGGNLMGFHVLDISVSPAVDFYATPGASGFYDSECSRGAEGSFDVTADAGMAVFTSRCFPGGPTSGIPEQRNIILMKLDGSLLSVRVTNDTDYDSSPVVGGVDAGTGYLTVYFLSSKAGVLGIWKQVVDGVAGNIVGGQTLVVSDVVDGIRAISFNADYSRFAFMKMVGGVTHIFVMTVADGAVVDLGVGADPYWSTNGNNMIMFTHNSKRYAMLPDGTGKVQIQIPTNISSDISYGMPACGDICLGNMVFSAAGY